MISSLDLKRIEDLLQNRQYEGVLFMLERYQHRALFKPTADSIYIDTLELSTVDTTALIRIIQSRTSFERNRRIARNLLVLVAIAVVVFGISLLYRGNYYGGLLIAAAPSTYALYRLYKPQGTSK